MYTCIKLCNSQLSVQGRLFPVDAVFSVHPNLEAFANSEGHLGTVIREGHIHPILGHHRGTASYSDHNNPIQWRSVGGIALCVCVCVCVHACVCVCASGTQLFL